MKPVEGNCEKAESFRKGWWAGFHQQGNEQTICPLILRAGPGKSESSSRPSFHLARQKSGTAKGLGWFRGEKLLVGVGLSADNPPGAAVVESKRREEPVGAEQEIAGQGVEAHRHRTQYTLR